MDFFYFTWRIFIYAGGKITVGKKEIIAYGFSKCEKYFVIATSSDLTIFKNKLDKGISFANSEIHGGKQS